jgi:apolipoprotein D and lipocalin family protein
MLLKLRWLFVCVALIACSSSAQPVIPIASLDVPRYMGTWYEIAKFPNRFQAQCASHTRARYQAQADGTVQVLNSCNKADGSSTQAMGLARPVDPSQTAKLKVRFAPEWLSWLPWVWGDYWVIDLDADYQLAAVSDAKREYLWVLSRTPQVSAKAYDALLERLQAQHFDVQKLDRTVQTPTHR